MNDKKQAQLQENLRTLLIAALAKNKMQATDAQIEQLTQLLLLIKKWNRVFNLTTIVADQAMVDLHIIDSLRALPYVHGNQLLDVGSGAGLPGLPLAIMQPDQHWTLLDKSAKKSRFLVQAVATLGLKHVTVVNERAQDFHPSAGFDHILSRAFAELSQFLTWTAHLLAPNGVWIAMKGKYPQAELAKIPAQTALVRAISLTSPAINIERHLLFFKKRNQS